MEDIAGMLSSDSNDEEGAANSEAAGGVAAKEERSEKKPEKTFTTVKDESSIPKEKHDEYLYLARPVTVRRLSISRATSPITVLCSQNESPDKKGCLVTDL